MSEHVTSIQALGANALESESFLALLFDAVEVDSHALLRIRDEELSRLQVAGVIDDGTVVAFAAWDATSDPLVLEYIAVDAAHRGTGLGRRLIDHVRGSRPLLADTDDDAVEFYRRLGFTISDAGRDARWPDRRRYRCVID